MILRLLIGIYILGCLGVILDLALKLNKESGAGLFMSLAYVLSRKESCKYIVQSWYILHKQ